eukprot:CAMPEP_0114362504 /NCGR_PEP_ID=MMETSP0101-20121206/25714_1 /TAXON_ID=38822 ORGANISM="Pteridomonas danica, Strain PT" /NCGR_SAMPLE_ID=MMETSP0101 /ASSEMBLY_ACC=CAM_ASM_000211 /LENGTH=80 /DNA_ID=CAMNT_0001508375 /DNA_START=15 /DNA_END=254 /DNA_ORIENTATION=-
MVEYVSEIRNVSGRPQFNVSLASSSSLIASSGVSPRDAWISAMRWKDSNKSASSEGVADVQMNAGIRITQRRLLRCQAVL